MQIRYLASVAGVHGAVPLRDSLSNLVTTTQYIPDLNAYAAILTLSQWNTLREEFWAQGRCCDHGWLIPSIDFVASDGKSFLDFEACRKHEADIAEAEFLKTKPQCGQEVSRLVHTQEIAGSIPATATNSGMVPATDEHGNVVGTVGVEAMTKGFGIKTAPDGPPVEVVAEKAPDSLEDRMLVVVGSNYMALTLVASLLKVEESAVRAVAESSGKFNISTTGKSISRAGHKVVFKKP